MSGNNGHSEWVRMVLQRHEADLLRYARRLTGDDGTARDVVQETFLRLCRQSAAELDGRLVEWLYTVCRHRAIDVQRKEHRMSFVAAESLESLPAGHAPPEAPLEQAERTSQLLEWLATLPERQQEVVRLKFQSGLRYREIATVTGLTESHVGVLLHEAIQTLRRKVRPT